MSYPPPNQPTGGPQNQPPPQYPQYGQPGPYGQQGPYNQPGPYGQTVPGAYGQPPAAGSGRPGTVTTASIIGIVLGGLLCLFALIVVLLGLVVGSAAGTAAEMAESEEAGTLATLGTGLIVGIGLLLVAMGAMYITFSVKAMQRRNWARITITVLTALGVLGNLGNLTSNQTASGGPASTVFGLAIGATIVVLYWLPSSSRWYAAKDQPAYPSGAAPGPYHSPAGPGHG